MAEFRKAEPSWETLLDIDKLAADEGEDWLLNWIDLDVRATRRRRS